MYMTPTTEDVEILLAAGFSMKALSALEVGTIYDLYGKLLDDKVVHEYRWAAPRLPESPAMLADITDVLRTMSIEEKKALRARLLK
jgi:hypothetical protein